MPAHKEGVPVMDAVSHTTPLAVLKAARDLISEPSGWVQGPFAVNSAGDGVDPHHPSAAAFCAIGATWAAAPAGNTSLSIAADRELERTLGDGQTANEFSDAPERTHAEVLDLFDRTIARLDAAS